jgi:AcrR family transcriptional regulator
MDLDKRQKIIEVAKEKFEQFGFKKTTVDEIVAGAGISKRTLYEIFDSKEKILHELMVAEFLFMRRFVRSHLKQLDNPLAQIITFFEIAKVYYNKNTFLSKVLSDEARLYENFLQDQIKVYENDVLRLFERILEVGIEKKIFRNLDVQESAKCIFVLYKEYTYKDTLDQNEGIQFIINAIINSRNGWINPCNDTQ